jgi:hypothetical protein
MISDKAKAAILDKCCQKVDCLARGEVIDLEGAPDLPQSTSPDCPYRGPFGCRCEPGECKYRPALSQSSPETETDTDQALVRLVDRFAKRLLAKLRLAHANGRRGWEKDDWEKDCQQGLLRHLEKGDPRDVAAYCAFMDHHGWITVAPPRGHAQRPPLPQIVQRALDVWSSDQYRSVMLPGLGARTCGKLAEALAAVLSDTSTDRTSK